MQRSLRTALAALGFIILAAASPAAAGICVWSCQQNPSGSWAYWFSRALSDCPVTDCLPRNGSSPSGTPCDPGDPDIPGDCRAKPVKGEADVDIIFGSEGSRRSAPTAPCAGAGGPQSIQPAPEQRMSWWPDRCGECSSSPECVGLLDGSACPTLDGSRAICRSTGEICPGSIVVDDRNEVSCYCDVIA